MKLKDLQIRGLRGAAGEFELGFPDGSLFIFGENGTGKTTVVDALEFLTTGDIDGYHRLGASLSAAIHLDAPSATVAASILDPDREVARSLSGNSAGPLREKGEGDDLGAETTLPDVPILRHSTIRNFMNKTAGEKRKALLELLGLESLSGFRDTMKSVANDAKDRRVGAEARALEEGEALESMLEGKALLTRAEELRLAAGHPSAIGSEQALAEIDLKSIPGEPNRHEPLAALGREVESFGEDPSADWNALVEDEAIRSSEALAALIEKGQLVLQTWEEDACPLCEVEQGREQLGESLSDRAGGLAEVRSQVGAAKSRVTTRESAARGYAQTLRAVLKVAPEGGWEDQAALEAAAGILEAYTEALAAGLAATASIPATPELGIDLVHALPELRKAADQAQASSKVAAHNALLALKEQHRRLEVKGGTVSATRAAEAASKRILEISEEQIRGAIRAALEELGEEIARYFGLLMSDPVYSDIKLQYADKHGGHVEFSLVFDGREPPMSPPQKIMSESRLNALGIALFLARAKFDPNERWRTLVLDDVVNSFDFSNRRGLMRLLRDEFAEWQVLVLSHDASFRDIGRYVVEEGAGWSFKEIVAWDPKGGIELGEGNPLNRLEAQLDRGRAASELAGLRAYRLGGGPGARSRQARLPGRLRSARAPHGLRVLGKPAARAEGPRLRSRRAGDSRGDQSVDLHRDARRPLPPRDAGPDQRGSAPAG